MKVFLKFNRNTERSLFYLQQWANIFHDYEKILVTDLFNETDIIPTDIASHVTPNKVLNTDINSIIGFENTYGHDFKHEENKNHFRPDKWKYAAASTLTCYNYAKNDSVFWIIDADDTCLMNNDSLYLNNKMKLVESILLQNKLDGLSLDFYRELTGMWSFGVACVSGFTDLEQLKTVNIQQEFINSTCSQNLDATFHILRQRNVYKLESFVIDNCGFIHDQNYYNGTYYWKDRYRWGQKIPDDVISL